MLKGKSCRDFTDLFSPNNFKDNYKVILNCFLNWNIDIKLVKPPDTGKINMYPQLDNAM